MLPHQARRIRWALLVVMAAVVASVAFSIRHPQSLPKEPPSGGDLLTKTDWEVHPLKDGKDVVLQAKKAVFPSAEEVRLQGVTFRFPYKLENRTGTAIL